MTDETSKNLTREEWLNDAANLIYDYFLQDVCENRHKPVIKFSFTAPSKKGRVLGLTYAKEDTNANVNEIFISAHVKDAEQAILVLTHELIHALDNCESHHRGYFARVAKRVGFLTPLTKLNPSDDLKDLAQLIADDLPPLPNDGIKTGHEKTQKNRNLSCTCTGCEYKFRTTKKWIVELYKNIDNAICPLCFSQIQLPDINLDD